ncbi:hypothetical protein QBC43DRAFT_290524 [Cladorrhinum sp. PSN259]|nr:hypothetical protein QBC43DRAFT_290524 [Cladorrhinum sp. PSN259]
MRSRTTDRPRFPPPRNTKGLILFVIASAAACLPKPGGGGGNGRPPTNGAVAIIQERIRRLPGVPSRRIPAPPCHLQRHDI